MARAQIDPGLGMGFDKSASHRFQVGTLKPPSTRCSRDEKAPCRTEDLHSALRKGRRAVVQGIQLFRANPEKRSSSVRSDAHVFCNCLEHDSLRSALQTEWDVFVAEDGSRKLVTTTHRRNSSFLLNRANTFEQATLNFKSNPRIRLKRYSSSKPVGSSSRCLH